MGCLMYRPTPPLRHFVASTKVSRENRSECDQKSGTSRPLLASNPQCAEPAVTQLVELLQRGSALCVPSEPLWSQATLRRPTRYGLDLVSDHTKKSFAARTRIAINTLHGTKREQ